MRTTIPIFFLLMLCATLFPQEKASAQQVEALLDSVKNYYYSGDYQKAIETLEKAKSYIEQMETKNRVEAYKYLAFSYIAFGEAEKAKGEFRKILDIDPTTSLDPTTVSPKIINVFEEVKAEYESKKPQKSTAEEPPPPAPSIAEKTPAPVSVSPTTGAKTVSTTGALWRSAVLPGWAELYKGHTAMGIVELTLWGGAVGFTAYSVMKYRDNKSTYDELGAENTPDEFDEAYDDMDASYRMRRMAFISVGGVWALSLLNAVLMPPSANFSLAPYSDGVKTQLTLRF